VCVEIGSARGRSTCYIAAALRDNGVGRLYAIDPHERTEWNDAGAGPDTFEAMTANLAAYGIADWVSIIRRRSEQVAPDWTLPIDLLFIDGDHGYAGVKRDFESFAPHVTRFGIVAFHDTLWDIRPDSRWQRADMGVPRFVDELRGRGFPVITLDKDFGVSLVQPHVGGIPLQ
jgi:predicted O-methyltransferase YrrM